eukprot:6241217-Amphidinium_carterae.1
MDGLPLTLPVFNGCVLLSRKARASYKKRPRAYSTRPVHGPPVAPTTVSLTTPMGFSKWNTKQYDSFPSDLAIQQEQMLQMMWNHTRNQASRVDGRVDTGQPIPNTASRIL